MREEILRLNDRKIMTVLVDNGANLKKLKRIQADGRIKIYQSEFENEFRNIPTVGKAFTIGVSMIGGPDLIADDNVHEIKDKFKGKDMDFNQVYTAWLNGVRYFITENPKDFIYKSKRESLEQLMPGLKIMRTEEFIKYLDDKQT
jgi:hypothetical protein